MKPRSLTFVVIALLTLSLAACKKTEKGESSRWDSGLRTIAELSATYPGFKGALAQQRSSAETRMEKAKKVEDKKARIKAMASANNVLSGGFVGMLKDVDTSIKKVKKDMVSLAGDAKTPEEKKVLEAATKQVEKTLASVDKAMKLGAGNSVAAAAVLKKATSDLKFASETLGEVSKRVSKRENDEKSAAAAKKADESSKTEAAKEAVAPWTCEYCSHENPHDAKTCGNCKAARPAK